MTETSRIDARRERTRQRLLDAGRALIAEKGVAGLRIQEITAHADVALGSFYNYFPTKEDLVEAVVEESLENLGAETVVDDAIQDPAITTSKAIRRVVGLAYGDPGFARLLLNLTHADALFARSFHPFARQVVERGIDRGRFSVPDIEAAVNLVVSSSLSLIRAILDGEHDEGVAEAHTEMCLIALGIVPSEARELSRVSL